MEYIQFLIDFILHVDVHLESFVQTYGNWVYGLLFLIIFVETGLVVMPFLPGDSLLFVTGALAGVGLIQYEVITPLLLLAAILGDQVNYLIGRRLGPKVFGWEKSRFFNKDAFDKAHDFYERRGPITIVLARFFPFIRTFAPFVAGVSAMNYRQFTLYNIVGGFIWVTGLMTIGYFFGNVPFVKQHLDKMIWAMILIPGALVLIGSLKAKKGQ